MPYFENSPLLPEKLKLCMDRELCPSNTPMLSVKKVNQSLFGDLDTRMKDLDEKAKLEDTLLSAPPKVSVHPSA